MQRAGSRSQRSEIEKRSDGRGMILGNSMPAAGVWVCGHAGTKGTASSSNFPGGRLGFVSWTDNGGNLWLFGGGGLDASGSRGFLNDLWRLTP